MIQIRTLLSSNKQRTNSIIASLILPTHLTKTLTIRLISLPMRELMGKSLFLFLFLFFSLFFSLFLLFLTSLDADFGRPNSHHGPMDPDDIGSAAAIEAFKMHAQPTHPHHASLDRGIAPPPGGGSSHDKIVRPTILTVQIKIVTYVLCFNVRR